MLPSQVKVAPVTAPEPETVVPVMAPVETTEPTVAAPSQVKVAPVTAPEPETVVPVMAPVETT